MGDDTMCISLEKIKSQLAKLPVDDESFRKIITNVSLTQLKEQMKTINKMNNNLKTWQDQVIREYSEDSSSGNYKYSREDLKRQRAIGFMRKRLEETLERLERVKLQFAFRKYLDEHTDFQ